jgi:hypothetical protein
MHSSGMFILTALKSKMGEILYILCAILVGAEKILKYIPNIPIICNPPFLLYVGTLLASITPPLSLSLSLSLDRLQILSVDYFCHFPCMCVTSLSLSLSLFITSFITFPFFMSKPPPPLCLPYVLWCVLQAFFPHQMLKHNHVAVSQIKYGFTFIVLAS